MGRVGKVSYSIYLTGKACVTCGHQGDEPYCPDPTYNLSPIFDLALTGEDFPNQDVPEGAVVLFGKDTDRPRGLRVLNGKTGAESLTLINHALDRCGDDRLRDKFLSLEPSNGWGTFSGAVDVLRTLQSLANDYPTHTWTVH